MTNSKDRYFYDHPLKALWMHLNHGIEFQIYYEADDCWEKNKTQSILNIRLHIFNPFDQSVKYYIHSDSEHIFQPREGDYGVHYKDKEKIFTFTKEYIRWLRYSKISIFDADYQIIMRDNKAFFSPKREDV